MRRILLVSVSTICMMSSMPALAGFEWTPPVNAPRTNANTNTAPAQVAAEPLTNAGPLTPEPVAPMVIEPLNETDILDAPPAPSSTQGMRRASTALPAAVEEPEQLTPQPMMTGPAPQVFVPSSNVATRVDGFGRRIPLSIALKQIVPPLYVYKFSQGVTPKQKVSWEGGDTWVNVLNNMLDQADLSGSLRGNVITISKGAGDTIALPTSAKPTLMPTSQASLMGGSIPSHTVDLTTRKTWNAARGVSLREAIQSWGRQAGVQVEWQSDMNYPVASGFNFEGTFDQAVDSILSLYADDAHPPKGKLYPNKPNGPSVLVVDSL